MRRRPAARLLVLDPHGRLLLFRFVYAQGALTGQAFWSTVGGEVEPGERFEEAAIRELFEETGFQVDNVGPELCRRELPIQLVTGEQVIAEERYFLVRAPHSQLSDAGWTELERAVVTEHRWWTTENLKTTEETVFPEDVVEMLRLAGEAPA